MKKNSRQAKKTQNKRVRSLISKAHVLIAIVAIIECLILISFTTYSWIETASSLIIETGTKYRTDTVKTRIPIADALNYKFIVNSATASTSSVADLNDYFSYSGESRTQNLYRFSRASSPDGKTFFFKSTGGSTAYRNGDIIDSNSNYTHFDFTVANTDAAKNHKLKFYFKDAGVFTVTNGDNSNLTDAQLTAVKNAMRISFQTGTGTPKIYSPTAKTYNAINTTAGGTRSVTTTAIQANENQKLFTVGKNSSQNISVRIWLEEKDSGITSLTGTQLAALNITINLQLTYAQNDYDYLYFDDYTFSPGIQKTVSGETTVDNIGGHLTEDYDAGNTANERRMFFAYSTDGSSYKYFPMALDDNGPNNDARSWVTCDETGSAASTVPEIDGALYITDITTSGKAALTYSYFGYGVIDASTFNNSSHTATAPTASTILYKWKLNGSKADSDGEMRYNAYGVTHTADGIANAYGAGGWSYVTPLQMVYFRDLATCVTDQSFNAGDNFKYISATAVNSATGVRNEVLYVNNSTAALSTSNNTTQAPTTTPMYYDSGADGGKGLFKAWVPSSWFTTGNRMVFRYCSDGKFRVTDCCASWTAPLASKPSSTTDYIYTALGTTENYDIDYYKGSVNSSHAAFINPGVGCWNEIEPDPVYFSTELIDNTVTGSYRYQIGVKINDGDAMYYHLVPDDSRTRFFAYVPVPGSNTQQKPDYDTGEILFRCYATHNNNTVNGTWLGKVRNGSRTYYPVAVNTTAATTSAPKGYWNIAVIVDGTYEHLFWVPETTVAGEIVAAHVLGDFYYNTTGHVGDNPQYTSITPNTIDEYRWYVPLDIDTIGTMATSVYFKWVPYTGTEFKYSLYLSDGIYCIITEGPDAVPAS